MFEAKASVLARLDNAFPALPNFPEETDRHEADVYLPHALTYLEYHGREDHPPTTQTISLTKKVAAQLLYQGQISKAGQFQRRSLLMATYLYGPASTILPWTRYISAEIVRGFHQFSGTINPCQDMIDEMQKGKIITWVYIKSLVLLSKAFAAQKTWLRASVAVKRAPEAP